MNKKKFKTMRDKILFLLETKEETRNSDVLLTIELWKKFSPEIILPRQVIIAQIVDTAKKFARDLNLSKSVDPFLDKFESKFAAGSEKYFVNVESLFDLPREDAVKRIRAQIQNDDGLFPPTNWEVANKRGFEEIAWRRSLGYPVTDKTGQSSLC